MPKGQGASSQAAGGRGRGFGGLQESLAAIGGAADGEALAFEVIGEEFNERGFVFGDEDERRRGRRRRGARA